MATNGLTPVTNYLHDEQETCLTGQRRLHNVGGRDTTTSHPGANMYASSISPDEFSILVQRVALLIARFELAPIGISFSAPMKYSAVKEAAANISVEVQAFLATFAGQAVTRRVDSNYTHWRVEIDGVSIGAIDFAKPQSVGLETVILPAVPSPADVLQGAVEGAAAGSQS